MGHVCISAFVPFPLLTLGAVLALGRFEEIMLPPPAGALPLPAAASGTANLRAPAGRSSDAAGSIAGPEEVRAPEVLVSLARCAPRRHRLSGAALTALPVRR
jgi:hypothetical protein